MKAELIIQRNNILDNLNFAMKFAAYINNARIRKGVEALLIDCTKNVTSIFNVEDEA